MLHVLAETVYYEGMDDISESYQKAEEVPKSYQKAVDEGKIRVLKAGYFDDEYVYQIDDKRITEPQLKALLEDAEGDVFAFRRVRGFY